MSAPPEVLKRAVEDWFTSEFGERARFDWIPTRVVSVPAYKIEFDTWLDYAMPFCPFEFGAHHHPGGPPPGFLHEANKMQVRLQRALDAIGWRVVESAIGTKGETCKLVFFAVDFATWGELQVWAGSAWWPEMEPFVTLVAIDRKVLLEHLRASMQQEAERAYDEDGEEFESVDDALRTMLSQDDRYKIGQLVQGSRELAVAYEALLRDGVYSIET